MKLGTTNLVIHAVLEQLSDPENWISTGNYQRGKSCLITACFYRGLEIHCSDFDFCGHRAQRVIEQVILDRWGNSRPEQYQGDGVVIRFNDHPRTTHKDIMWLLNEAEIRTRLWRRKPLKI